MPDIKVKEIANKTIKTLNKEAILVQKTKDNLVEIKDKVNNITDKDSDNYQTEKLLTTQKSVVSSSLIKLNKKGKDAVIETKDNIKKASDKVKQIKTKLKDVKNKREIKNTTKIVNNKIKVKNNIKNPEKVVKQSTKTANKIKKVAVESSKKAYQGTKKVVKITIKTIKGIIELTKALVSLIIAGGWIAVLIIVLLLLVGLLLVSPYGIFFSSSDINENGITMNTLVSNINNDYYEKINSIKQENIYDEYKVNSNGSKWKEVLSIYAVLITNKSDPITINDEKEQLLKEIFWKMNTITYQFKEEVIDEENTKKILEINVISKSLEDIMNEYGFNISQRDRVNELLSEEYSSLWSNAIFGLSFGSPDMVQIALSQVGNVGGEPYWRWYGFNERIEWCAVFVSWVSYQAGYLQSGIMPKFTACYEGVNFFKTRGEWKEKDYIPSPADIIFFDWNGDGQVQHVGIVEKVENGRVYTVEGNSTNDTCRNKSYPLSSNVIYGYGTPSY